MLMRKEHLLDNWFNNRFVKYTSRSSYTYLSAMENRGRKGKGQVIYQEKYIFLGRFINSLQSDRIEVWDIEVDPVLHAVISMEDVQYDSFYIIGSYLVVIECIQVDVYKIALPEKLFPLAYSFMIPAKDVTLHRHTSHLGRHDYGCIRWLHSSAGRYLMSSKCEEDVFGLHLWDIENASKVGYFRPPIDGFGIQIHSLQGSDCILQQYMSGPDDVICYTRFNIEKKAFSNWVFKYEFYYGKFDPFCIIFYNTYAIVFKSNEVRSLERKSDTICIVYNVHTSAVIRKRCFKNAGRECGVQHTIIAEGKFVILCNDGFHVVDALSLKTISHFSCDYKCYIQKQFEIFGSLFVVTQGNRQADLWSVEQQTKVCEFREFFDDILDLYISDLCTKMVDTGECEIGVWHFW